LTLDIGIQQVAERALREPPNGPNVQGAVIVMAAQNGDILAMVSNPSYDPNMFLNRLNSNDVARLNDEELKPQLNRATQGVYAPGSIFKIITGLTALESGVLDPAEVYTNKGYYMVGRERIGDLAAAGNYDFRRAFAKSSNSYFIEYGLRAGLSKILEMGNRFFLGQPVPVPTMQNARGDFPSLQSIAADRKEGRLWTEGNTAHVCIGQEIAITPMQMAVMTAAIANGGRVYWPRLVDRIEPPDVLPNEDAIQRFPTRLRGEIGVSKKNLSIIHDAMLADVEDPEGTGKYAMVPGMRIGGKTGTAQITRGKKVIGHTTWFVSFAPLENPKYVVVVMVEEGGSGGGNCGPVAQKIYREIQRRELPHPGVRMAQNK
jgi:penicillin-binding protein 2